MFVSGMNPALGTVFMVSTIMIALPSSVKVFNWIFTVWGSKPNWSTALLFTLAFVAFFIIGGLSGIFMASTPTDIHIHDTYFIVAHFHFVIMLGGMFGIFAATYHWFPKMFGRKMNETLGKLHFVLSFIPIFIGFYLMHQVGLLGQPRRYADIRPMLDTEASYAIVLMNKISTHSIFVFAASQLIFVFNLFYSMFFGEKVDRNPWRANSLEWEAPSPPPHGNFERIPVVYRGPYEYSHPAAPEDYLPQTHPPIPGEEQYTGH
jgi:cytochrome c oxidase subunit 1